VLVSIYMPTKDRLELLQRAVNSVLTQTHQEIELVVANDGSSDGTQAWLDQLAEKDPRVRAIHNVRPLGAPAARNSAIRLTRGEWVTGLDDDDEFMPERLRYFLDEATRLDAAGIRYSGLYSTERIVGSSRSYTLDKKPEAGLRDLFHHNHIGNQIFARRATYLEVGLFDEQMPAWQDLELFMRMVDRFGPAKLVPEPLYLLADDDRSDRISKKKKPKLIDAYERIVRKWPDVAREDKQRLFLQLLAPFYGFPIEPADLGKYFSLGISPMACARMAKLVFVRRRVGNT